MNNGGKRKQLDCFHRGYHLIQTWDGERTVKRLFNEDGCLVKIDTLTTYVNRPKLKDYIDRSIEFMNAKEEY